MYAVKLTLCFGLIIRRAQSFSCPCHDDVKFVCKELQEEDCPYGLTNDECGCCTVCIKGPGEMCGGFFTGFIACTTDYECVPDLTELYMNVYNTLFYCRMIQGSVDPNRKPFFISATRYPSERADYTDYSVLDTVYQPQETNYPQ